MDAAGLRERIRATLDPNADHRRQAEIDLKTVRIESNAWGELWC